MKRYEAALALLVAWVPAAQAAAAGPLPLTTLHAVHSISHEEAAKERPVDFEATVTYFRGYENTLFLGDGDDGIYVRATTNLPLLPGDRVRVRGTTRDSFSPIVFSSDLTLLRHGSLPRPVTATFHQLIDSQLDARYIVIRGNVVAATMSLSSGRFITRITLRMDGGSGEVIVDNSNPDLIEGLEDADVEIAGVNGGRFDGRMEQTGVQLRTSSFDQVKILRRAPMNAWSIPATPLDRVLHGYDFHDNTPRVRVQGTLTYYQPASMAVLQDGDRAIRVLTDQIDRLRVGDHVEAIGIPFVDNSFLSLKTGKIRSTGTASSLAPQPVNWNEMVTGKYAFDLVSMEGNVVSQVREHAQDVYIISTEGHLFSVTVRHPFVYEWNGLRSLPPMPEIRPGSKVRVTGVAVLDDGNPFNGAMAFGILLRTADDVAVLRSAPWINVQNLSRVISLLLLMVIAMGAWAAMMKQKVHRQTVTLAKRIEAEALLERRRSRILEDINARKPLPEVLEQITELVTSNLNGAACWLQIGKGCPIGNHPADTGQLEILRREIRSQSGPLHGSVYAAIDPHSPVSSSSAAALSMGAWLATLAIETRGLYSDLVHRSEFDLLTDIHNRFSLEKHMDSLIANGRGTGGLFGLVYIDLDEFKQVNDRYGHHIGDLYLQAATQRMKRQLRPGDLLARLGGDEFAALVPVVHSRADIDEIAERLERCFDEPFSLEGFSLCGSASVGVAIYPEDGADKDALLNASDSTMYAAKNRRRHLAMEQPQAS